MQRVPEPVEKEISGITARSVCRRRLNQHQHHVANRSYRTS